ncbi:MAG TPA: hypothetical protein VF577_08860 [Allosphingosinicella sp.]|jgi:hypothetical protein
MSVQRRVGSFSYAATASAATWTPRGPVGDIHNVIEREYSAARALAPASIDEFTYQLSRLVGIAAMGAGIVGTAALLFSI